MCIREMTTTERFVVPHSGEPDAPITFRRFPGEPARAKQMDAWIGQEPGTVIWKIPDDELRYVTTRNLAVFGESTDAGRLLSACAESMDRHGIALPPAFERVDADVRMGGPLA